MDVQAFFDTRTNTLTYVIADPHTRDAVIIDPVLDYDPIASRIWTASVDTIVNYVDKHQLKVHAILETHAHADHLSGAQALKAKMPYTYSGIGRDIIKVQAIFKEIFDLPRSFPVDGSQFDKLWDDGEEFNAGSLHIRVIATPGHTPACVSYLIGNALFVGDALFMPDSGTGRCDFPGGSAETLYRSITERIYALPDQTRVFVGHDYQPGGRALAYCTTVHDSKMQNIQLPASRTLPDFVTFRTNRDQTLSLPKLLFQSVQINIDAGHFDGVRSLKIPVNAFNLPTDPGTPSLTEATLVLPQMHF